MRGVLYGVGVGPGDPEWMTLAAARVLRQCGVIALPRSGAMRRQALEIALRALPELAQKPLLELELPMTRERDALSRCRRAAAEQIARELEGGSTVAFVTLGDPSIYSTYFYLHRLVEELGHTARVIPGVPSFCAAAARLGRPLCEEGGQLHIIPASYRGAERALSLPGTKVLMKAGRCFPSLKDGLEGRADASAVLNCGMEGERVYPDIAQAPDDAGYFSTVLVFGSQTAKD